MGNLRMNADQISYKGGNTPMTVEEALKNSSGEAAAIEQLQQDVSDLSSNKANKADIATEFSDLTNYNAGDLVYYDGALYEFQVDHTAGDWESSEVIQKDLSDIVTTLMSGLTGKQNSLQLGGYAGDLNALNENGVCTVNTADQTEASAKNVPFVGDGIVVTSVTYDGGYLFGIQFILNRTSSELYVRKCWGGYGSWYKLAVAT